MKRTHKLSIKQSYALIADYKNGMKTAEIAKKYGVDNSYPGLFAKRRGIKLRMHQDSRTKMAEVASNRKTQK